ncbi:RagB/SusD family nutrient uptake outer membrane protein [Agriterribacter sp.]|uniref:RagB/SusD family nutrient uptake outer membrane protein n=1 Tax=Agriterribacter sp. TaxID=2821509 RepID=UPI002CD1413D|nr:RagB/SusD family nutrient uptake outer membrane protein [Agriterribacter sp.]HRO46682.1 RagB/SusD family nutrient uptake outer membrane protein [Agriterribacter sp.]HRQ16978.1 RagB/SusD family nutrient uptake outer membrane protein [Agriterribacter sp.]
MTKSLKQLAITAIAVGSLAGYSCKKDTTGGNPPDVITGESVWKTDQEALATANAAFPPWQRLSSSFSFLLESTSEHTISFEGADDADGPLVSQLKTDVNNWYPTKIFNYLYVSIGEANRTIGKADSSSAGNNLSQSSIDLARARAKFIRAQGYAYLVNLWGEVPLILTSTPSSAEQTSRKSIDEVYTQIVKDFTEAEAALPGYDVIRSNPSKGAANALLARAYLAWASKPLSQTEVAAIAGGKSDPAAAAWDAAKLQKAVEYADKVINSGNYRLEDNFESNFGVPAENKSPEHIFTIHHDGDGLGDAQGNHQTHCPFTFRFDLYQDNHIGPADVSLVNRFPDNDKRKHYSLFTKLYNQDEPVASPATKATDYKEYDYIFPVTSPRIGKFVHRNAKLTDVAPGSEAAQPNNMNRIEIRYAEVLLIKAEALLQLGKATEAAQVINQLRRRAGVSEYSTITQDHLEKEWYLELYFEQRHWSNLVRWRKLVNTILTDVPEFEYYKDDYSSVESIAAKFGPESDGTAGSVKTNYPFFAKVHKHLRSKTQNISGKFYRFPIPKGLSGNDLGIAQNPGY